MSSSLGHDQYRERLHRAVADAEAVTGLQFCVVLCTGSDDPLSQAESAFARMGISERPAVLAIVDARRAADVDHGAVQVLLGPRTSGRLEPADCERASATVGTPATDEELVAGLEACITELVDAAGVGEGFDRVPEIPDVVTVSSS